MKGLRLASSVLSSLSLMIPLITTGEPSGPSVLGERIPFYEGAGRVSTAWMPHAADLNGDGVDEIVFSGFSRNSSKFRSAIVDNNGMNVTSAYLSSYETSSESTEVYDLNGDGKDDLIFWGGTDSEFLVPSYVYLSNKSGPHSRTKVLPKVQYHGSGRGDLDGDGLMDFVGTGYWGKGKIVISYKNDQLLVRRLQYIGSKCCFDGLGPHGIHQGSDIVVGNFDSDDKVELIISDYPFKQDWMAVEVTKADDKFIYVRDDNKIKLPKEYWETSDGKSIIKGLYRNIQPTQDGLSHDVRFVPFDINSDGLTDLIRVSRPWMTDGKKIPGIEEARFWPHYTHMQMLISKGNGRFTDQTSQYLDGWDMNVSTPYSFLFVDINNDGLEDIFYTAEDHWEEVLNTQDATAGNGFLVNTGKGFENYGTTWFKSLTKIAMVAAERRFDRTSNYFTAPYALGNFDDDDELEIASCVFGKVWRKWDGSTKTKKRFCAFFFSDIEIDFSKPERAKDAIVLVEPKKVEAKPSGGGREN